MGKTVLLAYLAHYRTLFKQIIIECFNFMSRVIGHFFKISMIRYIKNLASRVEINIAISLIKQ